MNAPCENCAPCSLYQEQLDIYGEVTGGKEPLVAVLLQLFADVKGKKGVEVEIALCIGGVAFVLGGAEKMAATFDANFSRCSHLPMPEDGCLLHIGWKVVSDVELVGERKQESNIGWSAAARQRAALKKERRSVREVLSLLYEGKQDLPSAIRVVRSYSDHISNTGGSLRLEDAYQTAKLLEFLIDMRLGQADNDVRKILMDWRKRFPQ